MAEDADKRESKRFEPPPWERDQFDALEQRNREQEASAAQPAPPPEPAAAPTQAASAAPVGAEEPAPPGQVPAGESAPPGDAQVDAMLLQLAAEEPRVEVETKWVGVGSSAALMLVGLSMLVWGLIGFARTKGAITGAVGALILLVIGGLFAATGVWLGIRATR